MVKYRNTRTMKEYTKDEWKWEHKISVVDYCGGKELSDLELEESFQRALESEEIELINYNR